MKRILMFFLLSTYLANAQSGCHCLNNKISLMQNMCGLLIKLQQLMNLRFNMHQENIQSLNETLADSAIATIEKESLEKQLIYERELWQKSIAEFQHTLAGISKQSDKNRALSSDFYEKSVNIIKKQQDIFNDFIHQMHPIVKPCSVVENE